MTAQAALETDAALGRIREHILDGEEELLSIASDLSPLGKFAKTWIVVTDKKLVVACPTGVITAIPFSEMLNVASVTLVGGGSLEIVRRAAEPIRIPYSSSMVRRFEQLARGIEQIRRGESVQLRLDSDPKRCEKCGRLMSSGKCVACIRRWATFRRITLYLRPYRGRVSLLITTSLVMAACSLFSPVATQLIVDRVLLPQPGFSTSGKDRLTLLSLLVGAILALRLAAWGAECIHGAVVAWLGSRITADIRSQVYRQLELLSLRFYDKHEVGGLMSRVSNDSNALQDFLTRGLPYSLVNVCTFAGILVVMFLMDWRLALFVALPVPAVGAWGFVFWRRMSTLFDQWRRAGAKFSARLGESLWGIRVIKAFGREEFESTRFERQNQLLFNRNVRTGRNRAFLLAAMGLVTTFGMVTLWLLGSFEVTMGRMTPGVLLAFYSYLLLFYGPLQWFGQVSSWMIQAFTGAERVFEILDSPAEDHEASGRLRLPAVKGQVTFEHVTFGYEPAQPVLRDVSMRVAPGEFIGIVGRSGAGKTTMMKLLCRFYDMDSGCIELDGIDIRQVQVQDLRSKIGVVLQESFLFSGTIAENICYGKPGATFLEIVDAARAANAHEFILSMPYGYDTRIGEQGKKLSGGEKQRVALARAILSNPPILILDEATSSVDPLSEELIQKAIARLATQRTTFAIAHRLSTLRNADRLIVMDSGQIVEHGTYSELIRRRGTFYHMLRLQHGAVESAAKSRNVPLN